jgi:hypothetical protein
VGRNNGRSQFKFRRYATITPAVWSIVAGEFTGDSYTDIAVYNPGDGSVWVGGNSGSQFEFRPFAAMTPAAGLSFVASEFTGDIYTDLAAYHPSDGSIWVGENKKFSEEDILNQVRMRFHGQPVFQGWNNRIITNSKGITMWGFGLGDTIVGWKVTNSQGKSLLEYMSIRPTAGNNSPPTKKEQCDYCKRNCFLPDFKLSCFVRLIIPILGEAAFLECVLSDLDDKIEKCEEACSACKSAA